MSALALIGVAVGLAMDAFAVSLAAGATAQALTVRRVFRLAFHFGLFQFLMPVLGWAAGQVVSRLVCGYGPWVAFGLLCFVGGRMLWGAWNGQGERVSADPTRGFLLVTLSIATSIDALAVGVSLAVLCVSVWLPSIIIGVVCGALTAVGMVLGFRVGQRLGKWAEVAGGVVLVAIGLRVLVVHLSAV